MRLFLDMCVMHVWQHSIFNNPSCTLHSVDARIASIFLLVGKRIILGSDSRCVGKASG